jgi:hypothetical protein
MVRTVISLEKDDKDWLDERAAQERVVPVGNWGRLNHPRPKGGALRSRNDDQGWRIRFRVGRLVGESENAGPGTPILPKEASDRRRLRRLPRVAMVQTTDLNATTLPRLGVSTGRESGASFPSERCVREAW